jgi:hypothetical protein
MLLSILHLEIHNGLWHHVVNTICQLVCHCSCNLFVGQQLVMSVPQSKMNSVRSVGMRDILYQNVQSQLSQVALYLFFDSS